MLANTEQPVGEFGVKARVYVYPNHSMAVGDFTVARLGKDLPTKPRPLDKKTVEKYIGLCTSELVELARTVTSSNTEATEFVRSCVGMDPSSEEPVFVDEIDVISAQADAACDLEYYSRDIFNEHGINLDFVFDEVHNANMLKKFPDGTFHTIEVAPGVRKVQKPPTWHKLNVPNVRSCIEQMLTDGSGIMAIENNQ